MLTLIVIPRTLFGGLSAVPEAEIKGTITRSARQVRGSR
jgi:hypothetical protein